MALDDTLQRLKRERDEADRRYNEALTALDRSVPAPPEWPPAPPDHDAARLAELNESWKTLAAPAPGAGWRGRLAGFIWRTIAPSLQRQVAFNSQLVDHLNRTENRARESRQHADEVINRLREAFASLAAFHTHTIQYLQQITAYIDTRDRESAGGALVLNASLSGMAEAAAKRWESVSARQARVDARVSQLATDAAASEAELRGILAVLQQASASLKRELEKGLMGQHAAAGPEAALPGAIPAGPAGAFQSLDSYKYVGFEDQFRGSRETIRARLESYLPLFTGAVDVLDVGCGRGEFLELLAGANIRGRGIDLNHEMAEQCQARGLDVTEADAVGYLSGLPDATLGGLFAAQVVEHLQPAYLLRFLELAYHKVRPGGPIVLETLNPACWVAFFDSYIRDITHVWPLHPDTLKYLVLASGFSGAKIEFRSPVPTQYRLQTLAAPAGADHALADVIEAFNANVSKLNARIFTHLDYAVIGVR
jgi:SAM-dependent methyltransferase